MRNLKPLLPYLARHKASFFLGILVLLLLAGVTLTQPFLLRLGIDSLQAQKFEPVFVLLILLTGLIQLALGFLQRWAIHKTGHKLEAEIRANLFSKIQQLDRSFFDETSLGDLIVHSTSDISIQRNFVVQTIISGFNTLFLGTAALALMFLQNWRLALVGLIFLPFLAVAFAWISQKTQPHYQAAQEQLGEVSNRSQEVFAGIRVVKAYNREEAESEKYRLENQQYVLNTLKFARLNSLLIPLIGLVMGLTTALLLWVGGNEIQAGRLTIGQFVQFNAYLLLLANPLSNVGVVVAQAQQAATSMGRLQKIFLLRPQITGPAEKAKELDPNRNPKGSVEFKGVSLRFGDRRILENINFRVEPGKTVAVVGPTGAGKSSLSSLVGRVYDPQEGQVLLDGVDVKDLSLENLRTEVAYVPQETLLFSLSLRDNIALAKSEATTGEVMEVTELSRLSQDLAQIPGGFEALVGERGVTLSGGQKQRTAIARALLPEAAVLILDDALSSVDARTQNLIAANLKGLTRAGRTTLIVTQRLSLVKEADLIVVLDQGRIVAQGNHHHLLNENGLYARMYQRELSTGPDNFIDDGNLDFLEETQAESPANPGITPILNGPGTLKKSPSPEEQAVPENLKTGKGQKKIQEEADEIVTVAYEGPRLTRLFKYSLRYWKILLAALPVVVGAALLETVGPLLSKIAIDQYIIPGQLDGLVLILGLYIAATFFSFLFRYLRAYLMQQVGQYVVRDLRVQLFKHLLNNSLAFFDKYPSGSLIGRLTSDMDAVNDLLSQGAVAIVADLVSLAAILTTMFILDWRLALVSLSVLPVLFFVAFFFRKFMRTAWRASRRKYSILVGYLAENYSGMLTIQLFNRQKANYTHFEELNQEYFRSNRNIVYANGIFLPGVTFLASSANALLLLVGGWLFIHSGNVTFGLLVAFFQYTERAFQPIRDLAERYTIFQAASASSERIFGLLDQKAEVFDPPRPLPLVEDPSSNWATVQFDKVSFGYNPEFPVIKNMSFTIQAGEKVAIVGPTGAGKTSLISLLGRNYDIQEGRITIGGKDLRELAQKDLRRHLALVLQDPVLFKGTIRENIGLGRQSFNDQEMVAAARTVGAESFIEKLPGTYDFLLQERGSNISAGQRQLLSFARAIAYNPKAILILDEATSSVDTESEAVIQKALEKLLEGRTALIIAHRLSTIQDVDRIIVVEKGRIAEMGTKTELLEKRGIFFQLYRNQASTVNK